MNDALHIFYVCVFMIAFISTLSIALFTFNRLTPNSIIFEQFDIDLDNLYNNVNKIFIIHSKMPLPITSFYTDGFCSHWSIGVVDSFNNIYHISISGFYSVIIHHVDIATLRVIDSKHYGFIGFDNYQFTINKNQVYNTKDNIKVKNVIDACVDVSKYEYDLFNHNCHWQIISVMKKLINRSDYRKLPKRLSHKQLFKHVCYEVLVDRYVFKAFKDKNNFNYKSLTYDDRSYLGFN